MKIIFAGTPEFAATALQQLVKEHEVIAVLTQPDRPKGRGMQLQPSPVKQLATKQGLRVLQPTSLKSETVQQELRELSPDVMVVAAYGLILPKVVLEIPKHGCLNIHASLLPRWRGAAPIQRAILAGDTETGITIMQMDEGLDTGSMLLKTTCTILSDETATSLHDKLANMGAECISLALSRLAEGTLRGEVQDNSLATYAAKLSKAESCLDWNKSASQLEREIRGYQPYPISYALMGGAQLKVFKAKRTEGIERLEPGKVVYAGKDGIEVQCAEGAIMLQILQKPGGKPLSAEQFLQGFPIKVGESFSGFHAQDSN